MKDLRAMEEARPVRRRAGPGCMESCYLNLLGGLRLLIAAAFAGLCGVVFYVFYYVPR